MSQGWPSYGKGEVAPTPVDKNQVFYNTAIAQLRALELGTKKYGRQLPIQAAIQLFSMVDALREIVEHTNISPATIDEQIAVESMVNDYIPSTVKAFLSSKAMQPEKEQLLIEQLDILSIRLRSTIAAVREHDSAQLEINGRFLRDKFG